ncbi:MAG: methylated-DNA--[protein]-cysteine S-methyltransferase [Actinomycetota bacterium]
MKEIERALARAGKLRYEQEVGQAADRLAGAAVERGLADICYALADSPLGPLLAARTKKGLVTLAYVSSGVDDALATLASELSPRVLEAPARFDDVRRELDEYFDGRRRSFDVPIDWALTKGFTRRVLAATARIPYGNVTTYGAVAAKAGSPRGNRAAGNALGSNPIPIVVPCHRVVRAGGALGGYGGGVDKKEFLLRLEGAHS